MEYRLIRLGKVTINKFTDNYDEIIEEFTKKSIENNNSSDLEFKTINKNVFIFSKIPNNNEFKLIKY